MAGIFSVRLQDGLASQVDKEAAKAGLSRNAWLKLAVLEKLDKSPRDSAAAILVSQVNKRLMLAVQRLQPTIQGVIQDELGKLGRSAAEEAEERFYTDDDPFGDKDED
jgi:hypothetical protein